jgi:hypothetical protein
LEELRAEARDALGSRVAAVRARRTLFVEIRALMLVGRSAKAVPAEARTAIDAEVHEPRSVMHGCSAKNGRELTPWISWPGM